MPQSRRTDPERLWNWSIPNDTQQGVKCEYTNFPLFSYFSVVVCLRCLLHHILSLILYTFQEYREFVFINIVQFMMSASCRIRFGLHIVFVCLYITPSHYHHCANFIWRHWTYKMTVRYNLQLFYVSKPYLIIDIGAYCVRLSSGVR